MADAMKSSIDDAVSFVNAQFAGQGHSEAILQQAIMFELQEKGFIVRGEVIYPVLYVTSTKKSGTVGHVRIDIEVQDSVDPNLKTILEVKRSAGGNHEAQLAKYKTVIPINAGIALANPDGVFWKQEPYALQ